VLLDTAVRSEQRAARAATGAKAVAQRNRASFAGYPARVLLSRRGPPRGDVGVDWRGVLTALDALWVGNTWQEAACVSVQLMHTIERSHFFDMASIYYVASNYDSDPSYGIYALIKQYHAADSTEMLERGMQQLEAHNRIAGGEDEAAVREWQHGWLWPGRASVRVPLLLGERFLAALNRQEAHLPFLAARHARLGNAVRARALAEAEDAHLRLVRMLTLERRWPLIALRAALLKASDDGAAAAAAMDCDT
jgi:hypothetical protein